MNSVRSAVLAAVLATVPAAVAYGAMMTPQDFAADETNLDKRFRQLSAMAQ